MRIKEKDGRGFRPVCGLVLWLCVFVVILSIEFGHWENSTGPKEKSHGQEPPQDRGLTLISPDPAVKSRSCGCEPPA